MRSIAPARGSAPTTARNTSVSPSTSTDSSVSPITRRLTSSIRPLTTTDPRSMIATDVQNSFISARMCDEIKTVFPSSPSRRRMFFKSIRPWGSTPLAGSSSKSDLRLGDQGLGQHQPLPHPPRQLDDHRVTLLGQPDHLEMTADLGRPPVAGHPVTGGEQVEELPDHQVFIHRRKVGHEADQPADVLGLFANVDAHDVDLAVGRLDQADHRPHRGGLARPVRPDQPAHFPRRDLERQVADRTDVVVIDPKVADADHRSSLFLRLPLHFRHVTLLTRATIFAWQIRTLTVREIREAQRNVLSTATDNEKLNGASKPPFSGQGRRKTQ